MTRLVLNGRRVPFTWSRLKAPANDWPCTPACHNDNLWHPLGAA